MMLRMVLRALVVWAIEVVALLFLTWLLPGLAVVDLWGAVATIFVIGLLNAVIRPLLLIFAVGLGLIPFAIIALFLNAVILMLAARFVTGLIVDGLFTAFVASIGLAALNAVLSGLLGINDEDSFYRNVVRKIARRQLPEGGDLSTLGTVIIQIDGLAEPVLRRAIDEGRMPTLARWLQEGTHRLVQWECDVPSMTSSGQAGILHGNNANIPAFRWYEKETGRLLVSNHPEDATIIDQRQATDHSLLRNQGSSVGNIFTGGADRNVMTMAALKGAEGEVTARPRDFYAYLVNPYNLYRGLGGLFWEVGVEYWQAWHQKRRDELPRMHRGGAFPWLRGVSNVIMRDATTWMLIDDMYSGRLVAYCDYLGYDEVAHHAGPTTRDALGALPSIDRQIALLESAAKSAPRPYQFVVVSDHGQSTGATFHQRYGYTLEQFIRERLSSPGEVRMASGEGEGWGHLNALLTEAVRTKGVTGKGAERLLGQRGRDEGYANLGPEAENREQVAEADVVVCASGNLALVYFAHEPGRLSLEQMVADYPGLIEALAEHEGIGFVMTYSEAAGGPVVMGTGGFRVLATGQGQGE
ncbi:MAG TPA: phage holin family protein, partial [Chloroflexota bacterium]|nr:phage holin family protein [Chloroflexota bacterium]